MQDGLESIPVDDGGRQAVLLQNGLVRVLIDRQGGMMPEFSLRRGEGWINVHYVPHFRGTDTSYCLGMEQATGAFANGLAFSRAHPELLGAPTTVTIPARSERIFRYGSLIVETGGTLHGPVRRVERNDDGLLLHGEHGTCAVRSDSGFELLLAVAGRADTA
jgi:hypothetical protein